MKRPATVWLPPPAAVQKLEGWLSTSKPVLQDISWALKGSTQANRRVETEAQLKGWLAQAFRSGTLCAIALWYSPFSSNPLAPRAPGYFGSKPLLSASNLEG
ncbi:MAG TPA: hypothetical protein VF664_04185, partial [Cystobacter sp.]